MKKAKKEKGVKIMGYVYVGCRTTKERNARGEGLKVYEVSEELQKTLEDIHKQWNDEEEVLEAFRDVLDKKKYIYESNGRWA